MTAISARFHGWGGRSTPWRLRRPGGAAQGSRGRADRRGGLVAPGDGLRAHRRRSIPASASYSAIVVHGHRLDLRLLVAPHQWADQRHLPGDGSSARWPSSIPRRRYDAYQATFLLGSWSRLAADPDRRLSHLGDLTRYISESVVLGFMARSAGLYAGRGSAGSRQPAGNPATKGTVISCWCTRLSRLLTLTGQGPDQRACAGARPRFHDRAGRGRAAPRRAAPPAAHRHAARARRRRVGRRPGSAGRDPGAHGGPLRVATIGRVPASLRRAPTSRRSRISALGEGPLGQARWLIAVLGLLEALAILESRSPTRRASRSTITASAWPRGLANLGGGFFQCLPGSGSLTRSAINYQSGAVSRVSGLLTAGAVALVVMLWAPLARYVPKSALAGILLVTAARLIDWRRLRYAVRASRFDAGLVLVTALSAIFIGVEFSILIGVGLSICTGVRPAGRAPQGDRAGRRRRQRHPRAR